MDALDALKLDIGRRRRTGDEGDGTTGLMHSMCEPRERLGYQPDDLAAVDHTDVKIRNETQQAPSFALVSGQRHRTSLCDRDGAAGQGAIDAIEVMCGQAVITDRL